MPQALALGLFYLGAPAVITNGLVGVGILGLGGLTPALVNIGISFGISAAFAQRPEAPKPEDVQQTIRVQTSYRFRHYGTMDTSGNWLFADTYRGGFDKVINLGQGELVEALSYRIDDSIVSFAEDGWALTPPYNGRLRLELRKGLVDQTYFAYLHGHFPEWTEDHRGRGLAMIYAYHADLSQQRTISLFPKLVDTVYTVRGRWQKLQNVTTGVVEHSDNGALVVRDYMLHADGARMPAAELSTPLALVAWKKAQARCDVAIPLKAGGTEKRWRLWGSYHMGERPGDVLRRMLDNIDARPIVTRDGGLAIDVRNYDASEISSFVLDNSVVTGFQGVGRGRDILTSANVVKATYLAADHDFQTPEADPWIDEDDVALHGEKIAERSFNMSPSHGQCRRRQKVESYRLNPEWVGTFFCRPKAMALFQEALFPVDYWIGETHVEGVFEMTDFSLVFGENGILKGVTITCQSMPLEAGTWNAAVEEGTAPVAETSVSDNTIPVPTGFSIAIVRKSLAGILVPVARISIDPKPINSLLVQAWGRRVGDAAWSMIPWQDGEVSAESFVLSDGQTYEFQVWFVTAKGREGNKVPEPAPQILAVSDPVAPAAPIDALAPLTGLTVAPSARAANDNTRYLIFKRGSVGQSFAAATQLNSDYIATPNQVIGPLSDSPGYGHWKYWFASKNGSGVVCAAPVSIIVDVYGPDQVTNGGFASDTDWTKSTGWTISGNVASKSAGVASTLSQALDLVSGAIYEVTYTITALSAGSFRARLGGTTNVDGTLRTAVGTYSETLIANASSNSIAIVAASTSAGSVDLVSVKRIG